MSAATGSEAQRYGRIGFLLIGLCFLLGVVSRGMTDSFSVFVLPIGQTFGVDRASVTGIYAIVMIGVGFGGPLTGFLVDRLGPKRMVLIGVAAMGLGLALSSLAHAVWQFYPTFGLLGGIGCAALGSVMQASILGRWFNRRLGTALATAYSANGVGVTIMAPLAQVLVEHHGWQMTYALLGGFVLLLLVPITLLPWRVIEAGHPALRQLTGAGGEAWRQGPDMGQALRSGGFWNLCAAFSLTSVGVYSLTPQIVPYLVERGFAPLGAASAIGFTGLLMPVGMIGFNWLADRGGRRFSVLASYACTMAGVACLLTLRGPEDRLLLALFVGLFGVSMGSRGPMISTLATLRFRGPHLGRIYGTITLAMGLGSALGAWLGGFLHDLTGGYGAIMALSLVALAGGALPLFGEAAHATRKLRDELPAG